MAAPIIQQIVLDLRQAEAQLDALERQVAQLDQTITVPVRVEDSQLDQLQADLAGADDTVDISVEAPGAAQARQVFDELGVEIDQVGAEARQTEQRIDALGDELDRTGGRGVSAFDSLRRSIGPLVATFAAGLGIRELVGQFNAAIDSATALSESINAVNVTFGDGADTVLEFGRNAAQSVGLATSEFNQLVVPLGALLNNFNLDGREAAEAANELATRASDLASVFNTDVTDALQAVGSALRGEQEPIRRYGVNLNQAAIDAKALELGLAGVGEEVDIAARGQAAYALILEQTAFAAGDFANTSDEVANRQRILAAETENARATIGEALLPAFESVLDIMPGVIEAVEGLAPAFGAAADTAADFIAGIFAIIETLGAIPDPVKIATAALLGLLGAARLVYAHPVIAGLGLVAAGVTAIGNNARAEKEQVDELRAAIETLLAVGDAEPLIGEIQTDIRELIGDSDELRRGFEKLGVPLTTLADFVIGDPAAIAEVETAVARVNEQFERGNQLDPFAIGDVRAANEFADALRSQANRRAEVAEETRKQRDAERDLADAGEFADKKLQQQIVTQFELNRATDGFADSLGRVFDQSIAENVLEDRFADLPTVISDLDTLREAADDAGQSLQEFTTNVPDDVVINVDPALIAVGNLIDRLLEVQEILQESTSGGFADIEIPELEFDASGAVINLDEVRTAIQEQLAEQAAFEATLSEVVVDVGGVDLASFIQTLEPEVGRALAEAFALDQSNAQAAQDALSGALNPLGEQAATDLAETLRTATPAEIEALGVFAADNFVSNQIRSQLAESAGEIADVLEQSLAALTISPEITIDLSNAQITGAVNQGEIPIGGGFGDQPGQPLPPSPPTGGGGVAPTNETVVVNINNPTTQDLESSSAQASQTIAAVSQLLPRGLN